MSVIPAARKSFFIIAFPFSVFKCRYTLIMAFAQRGFNVDSFISTVIEYAGSLSGSAIKAFEMHRVIPIERLFFHRSSPIHLWREQVAAVDVLGFLALVHAQLQ